MKFSRSASTFRRRAAAFRLATVATSRPPDSCDQSCTLAFLFFATQFDSKRVLLLQGQIQIQAGLTPYILILPSRLLSAAQFHPK
jgi:hypothetical protein